MLYTFPHFSRQQDKLPLTINVLGIHHLQEPVVRRSRFPYYQWLYCEDGVGELNLNGQKYILHPGQIALFFPMNSMPTGPYMIPGMSMPSVFPGPAAKTSWNICVFPGRGSTTCRTTT